MRTKLLILCVLMIFAGPARAADWPMCAYNRERANCTPEALEKKGQFTPLWGADLQDVFSSHVTPVVAAGTVFLAGWSGNVYALDALTGAGVWVAELKSPILSTACCADGMVYVGCHDGRIVALDAKTGETAWEYRCGGAVWTSPLVDSGMVLAGARDSVFYAIDAKSGREIWRFQAGERIMCTAACDGERVYFGSEDMRGHAIDLKSGKELWRSDPMPISSFSLAWPVIAGDRVIFTGCTLVLQYRYYKTGDVFYQEAMAKGSEEEKSQALQASLLQMPEFQSVFMFDLGSGKPGPVVAAMYNQGHWGPMAPPVVRNSGEAVIRSLGEHVWMSNYCGWSRIDLLTGFLSEICPPAPFNWLDVPYSMSGCGTGLFADRYGGNAVEFFAWNGSRQEPLVNAKTSLPIAFKHDSPGGIHPRVRHNGLTSPPVLANGILYKLAGLRLCAYDTRNEPP